MQRETIQTPTSATVTIPGLYSLAPANTCEGKALRLVIHGAEGECVQRYSGHAAIQLRDEGYLAEVIAVDPRPPSRQIPFDKHFAKTNHGTLIDKLATAGYLAGNTIHLISTPTPTHVDIATQLLAAGCQRLGVEKPLALSVTAARTLCGKNVYQVSHQLAKAGMRDFIAECRAGVVALDQIGHFDFYLLEELGVTPGRAVDNVLYDMHWHGGENIVVPLAILIGPEQSFHLVIDQVMAARYVGEPSTFAPARDSTLAAIKGRILCSHTHEITFRILAGKGVHLDKRYVVKDRQGCELRSIPLVETPRWLAHYHLLKELIKPVPDMLTTLEQAVGVVELCEKSVQMAVDIGTYQFGSIPPNFLE